MTVTRESPPQGVARRPGRPRRLVRKTSLFSHGEPMVWLTGGALAICVTMILGLLSLILVQGSVTFWPGPVLRVATESGAVHMGEVMRRETFLPRQDAPEEAGDPEPPQEIERVLLRTGNYELTNVYSLWITADTVVEVDRPEWGLLVERYERGRFYGFPQAFRLDEEVVADEPAAIWKLYREHRGEVAKRRSLIESIEYSDIGRINRRIKGARQALEAAEREHGEGSPEWERQKERTERETAEAESEYALVRERIDELRRENDRYQLVLRTASGTEVPMGLAEIMRAFPPNQLGFWDRLGVYLARTWQFVSDDPRHMNLEGGVYPAIFGTVAMTMIMCILVVPFGVLAALYLREYAKQGLLVSTVRIAVNNLAGVPSIVFGVFGLGFFCYFVGARIDELFFAAELPNPTYGKGGILWASLTLALLTLPVVIVATEEALAAVPGSMREGSYACGATKWQTIRRIVLPRALPGIMTGMVLAIARGAGEVAPLMLVGAMKVAPALPIDEVFPYVHPERSFMHLGFHIYDLGFQSPDSEAAKPMVFTTTLLLIGIVVILNVTAISIRSRLRKKFVTG